MTFPVPTDDLTTETVSLLRDLIRNACVNDGSPDSGHEMRSVETLQRYFDGVELTQEVVEPHPGRGSLVARIPGTDPEAPSLMLLGHLDVVPVHEGWSRDPFAADIVDGMIWGRGTLDMLHLTAAYAVVTRRLAASGTRLEGDLVFAAVADEEAGGGLGARWLVENRPDLVRADGVISESGGAPLSTDGIVRGVTVTVGEKGISERRLIATGRPAHGSTPWGSANAAVMAAEAIGRIVEHPNAAVIGDLWPQYVAALEIPTDLADALTDPEKIDAALAGLGPLAGLAHAVTHTTVSPTIVSAGDKINVIPGRAEVQLDIRTLPSTTPAAVDAFLADALGPLKEHVRVEVMSDMAASRSTMDGRLYRALEASIVAAYPEAQAVPVIAPGGSDGRFFRNRGIPAYGFGLLSPEWQHAEVRKLLHSTDERIDLASVGLAVHAIDGIVRDVLG